MTNAYPAATPPPGPLDELETVVARALDELPHGDGRQLVSDAVNMFDKADRAYATELADVDTNWARLEVGAAEARRAEARTKLDAERATAARLGEAGAAALLADLEATALPKPPAPGSPVTIELRDELTMLLGPGTATSVASKLLDVARSPRRDLAGLLFSPWFDSFVKSRGGLHPDVLDALRAAAVAAAEQHGTPDEQRAAARVGTAKRTLAAARAGAASRSRARQSRAERAHRNKQAALSRVAAHHDR